MKINAQELKVMEVNDDNLEDGLSIRNHIFSPITIEQWYKGGPSTGSIAYLGDEVVGFIPLLYRDIILDQERTIRTVYENAVGTAAAVRGQGVGSKMIEGASEFLKGKADVMMLYRGGERSQGYRFYEKTGHVDVQYLRTHVAKIKGHYNVSDDIVVEEQVNHIRAAQKPLVLLFEKTYAGFAGFPKRHDRYWDAIFNKHYFAARPHIRFVLFQLMEQRKPTAYGLFSIENRDGKRQLKMLEMASLYADFVRMSKVLTSALAYGEKEQVSDLVILTGDEDPFIPLLQSMGFENEPRGRMHMSRCFDPKGLMDKYWADQLMIPGIQLYVLTPSWDLRVGEVKESSRQVTIEMKDHTLAQWLLGRIDFKSRVREGTVTIQNGNSRIVDWIDRAIPLNMWQYHEIDFC